MQSNAQFKAEHDATDPLQNDFVKLYFVVINFLLYFSS